MDEPLKHYTRQNKAETKGQILYDSTYVKYLVKFIEAESSMREREIEFQFRNMKTFGRWILMTIAQQCECTECPKLYT